MGPALANLRLAKRTAHRRGVYSGHIIPHEARPGDKQFTNDFLKP